MQHSVGTGSNCVFQEFAVTEPQAYQEDPQQGTERLPAEGREGARRRMFRKQGCVTGGRRVEDKKACGCEAERNG